MAASSMNESLIAMFPTPSCKPKPAQLRPQLVATRTHDKVPAGLPAAGDGLIHHVVRNKEVRLQLRAPLR